MLTGRPVEPLFLPLRQAVPATSKWAQLYFLVNLDKKHHAVIVPASLPPKLVKSANGLSS